MKLKFGLGLREYDSVPTIQTRGRFLGLSWEMLDAFVHRSGGPLLGIVAVVLQISRRRMIPAPPNLVPPRSYSNESPTTPGATSPVARWIRSATFPKESDARERRRENEDAH